MKEPSIFLCPLASWVTFPPQGHRVSHCSSWEIQHFPATTCPICSPRSISHVPRHSGPYQVLPAPRLWSPLGSGDLWPCSPSLRVRAVRAHRRITGTTAPMSRALAGPKPCAGLSLEVMSPFNPQDNPVHEERRVLILQMEQPKAQRGEVICPRSQSQSPRDPESESQLRRGLAYGSSC